MFFITLFAFFLHSVDESTFLDLPHIKKDASHYRSAPNKDFKPDILGQKIYEIISNDKKEC